jgi:DNA-binding HxlR family transcriptional regulator
VKREATRPVFEVLGDRWVLAIVEALRAGERRFTDLQNDLGINPITLTCRLRDLETTGLLDRLVGTANKQAVAYRLTPTGRGALPVLDAMESFGQELRPARTSEAKFQRIDQHVPK